MPKFKVPVSDGPISISLYDGGLVREQTWDVKDGVADVADEDVEFFTKQVTGAESVDVSEEPSEETPRTHTKAGNK
jgi:hypothetical protein